MTPTCFDDTLTHVLEGTIACPGHRGAALTCIASTELAQVFCLRFRW
jgi:hypothetical protein